ncbi:hypothetical protein, partial [Colwellia sp. MB02u-9]|uniref:hypothetical protein n=1 Tax=Colwellia sp. MB02u-9 TaxID=2759823 RepID=UPI001C70E655
GVRHVMNSSSRIVLIMNWISDKDCLWWPLLKLRPSQDQIFSNKLVIILAFIATVIGHSIIIIIRLLSGKEVPLDVAIVITIILFLLALTLNKFTSYCWNVRMKALSVKQA